MRSNHTLAIVVTAYNSGRYIHRALYSIYNQTRPFDEVIIVDHASTDDTSSIISSFAKRLSEHSRYQHLTLSFNSGGPSWARNYGISFCESDFICFLDADDFCSSDRSYTIHSYLKFNLDILCHSFYSFIDVTSSPDRVKLCSLSNTSHCYRPNLSNAELLLDFFLLWHVDLRRFICFVLQTFKKSFFFRT